MVQGSLSVSPLISIMSSLEALDGITAFCPWLLLYYPISKYAT